MEKNMQEKLWKYRDKQLKKEDIEAGDLSFDEYQQRSETILRSSLVFQ